jgi:hypothetical protein
MTLATSTHGIARSSCPPSRHVVAGRRRVRALRAGVRTQRRPAPPPAPESPMRANRNRAPGKATNELGCRAHRRRRREAGARSVGRPQCPRRRSLAPRPPGPDCDGVDGAVAAAPTSPTDARRHLACARSNEDVKYRTGRRVWSRRSAASKRGRRTSWSWRSRDGATRSHAVMAAIRTDARRLAGRSSSAWAPLHVAGPWRRYTT